MAGRSVKYGIFWEPGKDVAAVISRWKQKVSEVEPDAVYLHHPVHSTFFLLMSEPKKRSGLTHSLAELCDKTPPVNVELSGWHIFKNDAATGGDTITLGIQPEKSLFQLQLDIAKTALKYSTSKVEYPVQWEGVFAQSYHEYGFPFVGSHWLPHVSVASVRKEGKQLLRELSRDNTFPQRAAIQTLALYQIDGDQHRMVERFLLR
jgi:hypothetical protein